MRLTLLKNRFGRMPLMLRMAAKARAAAKKVLKESVDCAPRFLISCAIASHKMAGVRRIVAIAPLDPTSISLSFRS